MTRRRARWDMAYSAWRDVVTGELLTSAPPGNPRDALDITARLYDARPNVGPQISTFIPRTGITTLSGPNPAHPLGWWVGYEFFDQVVLNAFGLVIKQSLFHGSPVGMANRNAIKGHTNIGGTGGGVLIEDSAFINLDPNNFTSTAMSGGWYNVRRCKVSGFVDGLNVTAPTTLAQPTLIHGNWIHNGNWGPQPAQTDGQTHNDGTQVQRGKNVDIRGNYYGGRRLAGNPGGSDDYNNAGLMIQQEVSSTAADRIENLTVKHNIIEGGATCMNLSVKFGNTLATADISANDFVVRNDPNYPSYIIVNSGIASTVSDNRFLVSRGLVPLTDYR